LDRWPEDLMNKLPGIALTAALSLLVTSPALARSPKDVRVVARGVNSFACDLYGKLAAKGGKQRNLSLSPYSIATALAMTYAGATGSTAAEMRRALHFELPQTTLHPAFGALIQTIAKRGNRGKARLDVANALWAQRGLALRAEFVERLRRSYAAELRQLDFKGSPGPARATINRWVEKKTQRKIRNLIARGMIKPDTRLVLANALYFHASWAKRFHKYSTRKLTFFRIDGSKRKAPFMRDTRRVRFTSGAGFRALELPYRGHRLSMVVLLPRKRGGLKALEAKLSETWLRGVTRRLRHQRVRIYLPKFKTSSSFSLASALKALGIKRAFTDAAEFSGITKPGSDRLKISKVVHKTFVSVSENGTEAAAATAVMMLKAGGMPMRPPRIYTFRADHPFIYLLRDRSTGTVLFIGRVVDPTG
jgi:serpin B